MSLLVVGCGYVGMRVAKLWLDENLDVYALTRSRERFQKLQGLGIHPIVGHWMDETLAIAKELADIEHVLVAVPHREDLGLGSSSHQTGLKRFMQRLPQGWRKLVYLSTTGVYGESKDEMVDADTPAKPTRLAGEIAFLGEQWLAEHIEPQKYTVLRLAGIYGPGRIPLVESLRRGEALAVPRAGFLNLIHVDDIARVVRQLMHQQMSCPCYVLSDGQPVPREEFYRELANLCGIDHPEFVEQDPESSRGRRARASKRINPRHLLEELNFRPFFPSFREGLRHCLAAADETGG